MTVDFVPDRGDIVWVDFDPVKGHEQGGHRPALVISPYSNNNITGMIIVCPITSKIKNYIFEVRLESETIAGSVLVDQLRSIDLNCRNIKFIEKSSNETIAHVIGKMLTLLT